MRRQEDGEAKRGALVQEDHLGQPVVVRDVVELLVAVHVDVHAFRRQPVAGQVEVVILDAPGWSVSGCWTGRSVSVLPSTNSQPVHLPCIVICVPTSAKWDRARDPRRAVGRSDTVR